MNYLDRNEFNFEPSQKVIDAVKSFDPKELCFYTRIYDQGKKSVISVRVSEIYGVPEEQVLLAYGGEDILKNAIHYFLTKVSRKTPLHIMLMRLSNIPTAFIPVCCCWHHPTIPQVTV